jgi:hypothetical protein
MYFTLLSSVLRSFEKIPLYYIAEKQGVVDEKNDDF